MATDINGVKVRLYLDGDNEPATRESAEWKEHLKKLPETSINIGGLMISGCSLENISLHQESFEYYMRRGDKYYFRGVQHKVVVTLPDPSVFSELKYHDQVDLKWVAED